MRRAKRARRSPEEQIAALDNRLGVGVGAREERARLAAQYAEVVALRRKPLRDVYEAARGGSALAAAVLAGIADGHRKDATEAREYVRALRSLGLEAA